MKMRVWLQCGHRAARVAMPVERMTDCFKHRKDVAWLISLYLDMHAFFGILLLRKQGACCLLSGSLA